MSEVEIKTKKEERKELAMGLAMLGITFIFGYKYGLFKAKNDLSSDFMKVLNNIDRFERF